MSIAIVHCYKTYKPDEIGGVAEAISLVVSARQPGLKHSVLVARSCGLGRTYFLDGVRVDAVSSFGMVSSMPVAPSYPFAFGKMARTADLIVQHSPFPLGDIGILLAAPEGTAVIVHWHADLVRSKLVGLLINPLLRHSLKRADRIIVPHQSVLLNSPHLKDFAPKCVAIPYGVDFRYWANLTAEEQQEVNEIRNRHPQLIVSTGRLVSYKGHEVLLHALQNLDATVLIIGKGPLKKKLQALAQDLGIEHRVILAGWQERNRQKLLLHAARVFAFCSVSSAESFGIAQLEAMAAGLPIVNTALPTAVPHVARHGLEALTVAPGDAGALRSALQNVLEDHDLADRLGRAAQSRVELCFNRQSIAMRIRQVYEEAVTRRAAIVKGIAITS